MFAEPLGESRFAHPCRALKREELNAPAVEDPLQCVGEVPSFGGSAAKPWLPDGCDGSADAGQQRRPRWFKLVQADRSIGGLQGNPCERTFLSGRLPVLRNAPLLREPGCTRVGRHGPRRRRGCRLHREPVERPKRSGRVSGVLEAVAGRLRSHGPNPIRKPAWIVFAERFEARQRGGTVVLCPARCRVGTEGWCAHRHLVGDDADLVEIGEGSMVAPACVELLGCHVNRGADHALRALCKSPAVAVCSPGDAEVTQPKRLPLGRCDAEQVRWFDVAMQDAPRVGMSYGREQLTEQRGEPAPGKGKANAEQRVGAQLHDKVGAASDELARRTLSQLLGDGAKVVDLHDVGVVEPSHGADLSAELLLEPRSRSGFTRDHLYRHIPLFRHMATCVDLAHGACADAISHDEGSELQPWLHLSLRRFTARLGTPERPGRRAAAAPAESSSSRVRRRFGWRDAPSRLQSCPGRRAKAHHDTRGAPARR